MGNKNKQKFCCPLCCLGGMSHTKNDLFDMPTADGGHILHDVDDGLYSDDGDSGAEEVESKTESPMNAVYLTEDQVRSIVFFSFLMNLISFLVVEFSV